MSFAMTETEKNWLLASAAAAAGEYVGFSSGDVCGAWPLALAAAAVAAFAMFGACLPRWYLVPVFLTALAAAMASECGSRETLDGILELSRGRARDVLVEVEKDARVFSARGDDAMCARRYAGRQSDGCHAAAGTPASARGFDACHRLAFPRCGCAHGPQGAGREGQGSRG